MILGRRHPGDRAGCAGVYFVVNETDDLEAGPEVVGGGEDVVVGVCSRATGGGYFYDLVVGGACWDGTGPGSA